MRIKPVENHNQIIGKWGESCAAEFLRNKGFIVIDQNVRTPEGEIDLIVKKEELIVFVEVKTRTSRSMGYPEEAVTDVKLDHMVNSGEYYIQEHPDLGENWRIDVIAIIGKIGVKNPQIEWFEDAG